MNSLERRSSFDTAGLKKTKAKSIKEETVDLLFADTVNDAVTSVRNWIEVCTNYYDVNGVVNVYHLRIKGESRMALPS